MVIPYLKASIRVDEICISICLCIVIQPIRLTCLTQLRIHRVVEEPFTTPGELSPVLDFPTITLSVRIVLGSLRCPEGSELKLDLQVSVMKIYNNHSGNIDILFVLAFSFGSQENCNTDYLELYDVTASNVRQLVSRFCGNVI